MVSHLTSGEKPDDAMKRNKDLKNILSFIEADPEKREKTVILQDSNFSDSYKEDKDVGNVKIITDNFLDGVGIGNECFKMRGCAGGQSDKFCQLMFDQIDRILVPKSVGRFEKVENNFKFAKYTNGKKISDARNDEKQRADLIPEPQTTLGSQSLRINQFTLPPLNKVHDCS